MKADVDAPAAALTAGARAGRLLPLLLARGHAGRETTFQQLGAGNFDGPADVIELDVGRVRPSGQLAEALEVCDRHLARDGAVYIRAARLQRRRVASEVKRRGWRVSAPFAVVRDAAGERVLTPLTARAFRRLVELRGGPGVALVVMDGWSQRLRLDAVAVETAPGVGLLASRMTDRAPLSWLAAAGLPDVALEDVVMMRGWRGAADSVLLHVAAAPARRAAAVKLTTVGARGHEDELLQRLGPAAAHAGVIVPEVLGATIVGGRRGVAYGSIAGRRAVDHIGSSAARAATVFGQLAEWLARWNRETAQRVVLSADRLKLEEVAAALNPWLPDAAGYFGSLRALAATIAGHPVPVVATHGDLTLYNVIVQGEQVGIVDWESADEAGLPLTDLEYLAVDVACARAGYRDRPAAWRRCFTSRDGPAQQFRGWRAESASRLGLPPAYAELCHHLGWLRHAVNELAQRPAERPFLDIARHLIDNGVRVE